MFLLSISRYFIAMLNLWLWHPIHRGAIKWKRIRLEIALSLMKAAAFETSFPHTQKAKNKILNCSEAFVEPSFCFGDMPSINYFNRHLSSLEKIANIDIQCKSPPPVYRSETVTNISGSSFFFSRCLVRRCRYPTKEFWRMRFCLKCQRRIDFSTKENGCKHKTTHSLHVWTVSVLLG